MNLSSTSSSERWSWGVAGLLLLGYWLVAMTSLAEKCTTTDEIAHLTAGCAYWEFNDYRLNPENGNLPQRWCALPVVLTGYGRLPSKDDPAWRISDVWSLGKALFRVDITEVNAILFRGRAASALLGVGVAFLVWRWSRALWGNIGGLLSLAVCVLCPTMLAHGPLMTSDMCVTLFLLASVTAVWAVLHRLDLLRLAGCSLLVGCLFLSKLTAVLLIPMSAVLVGVRLLNSEPLTIAWRGREWHLHSRVSRLLAACGAALVCAAVSLAMVWLSVGLRYSAFNTSVLPEGSFFMLGSLDEIDEDLLPSSTKTILTVLARTRVLPESYIHGAAHVLAYRKRCAFLRGEYSTEGWLTYFPFCFLVKTPWPLFAMLGLAAITVCNPRMRARATNSLTTSRPLWYRTAPLWTLWIVYWIVSVNSSLNIGHRHILPTYPELYIAAGAAVGWLAVGPWLGRSLITGVLLWSVAVASLAFPHYLAYFNPLVRSDRAYLSLVDSNLDWGQDLPGLKKWLSSQHLEEKNSPPVYLSYFGNGDPPTYGIRAKSLLNADSGRLRGGVYCVSASMLMSVFPPFGGPWNENYEKTYLHWFTYIEELRKVKDNPAAFKALLQKSNAPDLNTVLHVFYQLRHARLCAFLRRREPDHEIGYSILIYRLSDDDIQRMMTPEYN